MNKTKTVTANSHFYNIILFKMISNTSAPENQDNISRQEASAKLRESFLQAVNELNGQSCSILTYEQNRLTANFSGWKTDGKEVLVRDFRTPLGIMIPAALLRSSDIIAIEFHSDVLLP